MWIDISRVSFSFFCSIAFLHICASGYSSSPVDHYVRAWYNISYKNNTTALFLNLKSMCIHFVSNGKSNM